jgi:hypothetical protein
MEGINSDRLRFSEAVEQNNRYVEYLLRKYHLNVLSTLNNNMAKE